MIRRAACRSRHPAHLSVSVFQFLGNDVEAHELLERPGVHRERDHRSPVAELLPSVNPSPHGCAVLA